MKKTLINLIRILIVALLAGQLVNCGSKQNVLPPTSPIPPGVDPGTPAPPRTDPPGTPGSGGPGTAWERGATAQFDIDSISALEDYALATRNNPSDFRININLRDVNTGPYETFGGEVRIGYYNEDGFGNATYHEGVFRSGTGAEETQYNQFVNVGPLTVFKSFFEDNFGAILIVMDGVDDLGLWAGSIYYKNWDFSVCAPLACAPKPPKKCWLIEIGPYDCRDFLDDDEIDMSSSLYPSRYRRLGRFRGLDLQKALNLN